MPPPDPIRVKTCTVGKLTKVCFIKLDWTQLYWGSNYNCVDYVILRSCTMCGNIGDKNLWKQTITKYWGISHFNGLDCQSQHLGLLFFGSDCAVSGIEKQLSTWGTKVTGSGHESLSQDGMSESDCHKD